MVQALTPPKSTLAEMAERKFPEDRFERRRDVVVFAEHTTTDSKGDEQVYDRAALEAIVERCNHRIWDTDNYAVLSDGHTPDEQQRAKGMPEPEVLGFVGNFRLTKIGRDKPRYAIIADEFIYRDKVDQLSRLPGRSVELWQAPDMRERFFDPIAALGSTTPRLDMGINYSGQNGQTRYARLGGVTVEKYLAAAPSGGNTFLPDATPVKRERYDGMLSDQDVGQIVAAIEQTDWAQWVKGQMAKEQAPMPSNPEPEADYQAPEPLASDAMPNAAPGDDDQYQGKEADMADTPDKDDQYNVHEPEVPKPMDKDDNQFARGDEAIKYRKLQDEVAVLKAEGEATKKQLAEITREKQCVTRYAQIDHLESEGYLFDKAVERTRADAMGEESWNGHYGVMVENYQRAPLGTRLFIPETERTAAESVKARDKSAAIRKYALANELTYDQAREKMQTESTADPAGKPAAAVG